MYSRRHTIIRSNTFKILTSSVDGAAWSMLKDDGIENCFENCSSSCMLLHLNPPSCWSLPLLRNHCSCAREGAPANTPRIVNEYSLNTMQYMYIRKIPYEIARVFWPDVDVFRRVVCIPWCILVYSRRWYRVHVFWSIPLVFHNWEDWITWLCVDYIVFYGIRTVFSQYMPCLKHRKKPFKYVLNTT